MEIEPLRAPQEKAENPPRLNRLAPHNVAQILGLIADQPLISLSASGIRKITPTAYPNANMFTGPSDGSAYFP
ncbi:hypothetical protein D3C76_1728380 [compost metagenome]